MNQDRHARPARGLVHRLLTAGAAALAIALLFATAADADYQQVGNFAQSGEGEQLEFATAMAVNVTGAGGVDAGSVYAVGRNKRVLRYTATGEFREAWGWGVATGAAAFERCGPAVIEHPACIPPSKPLTGSIGGEEPGQFEAPAGVAVDQATGNVYVLNSIFRGHREQNLIEVFSADGSALIARFGDAGAAPPFPAPAESIAEGPGKLHEISSSISGLAVDEAGRVYLTDADVNNIASPPGESRVMCFEPQAPGDYEHYVYCGRGEDIVTGVAGDAFWRLALDDAGHLYGANNTLIKEFSLADPTAPICSYQIPGGQLQAMTVNPETGEVFYFAKKALHRLAPCNSGSFKEAQEVVKPTPPATEPFFALTLNPELVWGPNRPAGVLYGADGKNYFSLTPQLFGSGDIFAPAEIRDPSVESESIANTGATSTTLRAEIDPSGFGTRFVFQYLSEAAYEENEPTERFAGAKEAPPGGGEIGGGSKAIAAAAISGLQPDTAYRFRAIATSECDPGGEPCVATGEAVAFRTYSATAPGLPDHRAYELVSPAHKSGGEVFPAEPFMGSCGQECKPGANLGARYPMQSVPGGDRVVYEGYPFSASEGAPVANEYLSRRTASGWQTTALSPALGDGGSPGHLAFDAELSNGLIAQGTPTLSPEAPPGYRNLYAQVTADPAALSPLLTVTPPNRSETAFQLGYASHSADFSRQFFSANDALSEETPFAPEAPDPGLSGKNLYESQGGQPRLINVLPGNATVATGATFASPSPDTHTISADGSRVFWTDGAGHLYVRENAEATLEVPGASASVKFLTASSDGSKVLLSNGCLYDLEAEACDDLTGGQGGFQGIAGQSAELSHLYFVDTAVLSGEEENEQGDKALAAQNNLYAWDEGALRFIATLLAQDNGGQVAAHPNDWAVAPSKRTAEASPSGRWLAFLSEAPLTGYENVGPNCAFNISNEPVAAPCAEVFLYDSATGELRCASCNPTGEPPLGHSVLRRIYNAEEWLPQPRYLSDSGRLYFDSSDRLSPLDSNDGVEDVYEFEPQGVGSCTREAGCVSLISTGAGANDSNLLAVDESGKNVFFTTRERLVISDIDELIDVYDAREGGGIAAETETTRPECQGEACQPSPAPPNDPTPASAGFRGAGNVSQGGPSKPRCPKGKRKVRKQGKSRCVKAQHKRAQGSHRTRANPNRGGAR
jgi:hypothetical protein